MFASRRQFIENTVTSCIAIGAQKTTAASLIDSHERSRAATPEVHTNLLRINEAMRTSGIHRDPTTGLDYFSGYSSKTLYDWDSYFEGIVQMELGWSPKYMIDGVKIFLDAQQPNGFVRRVNDPNQKEEGNEMAKPFLAQISLLISRKLGKAHWLDEHYYQRMRNFLLCWLTVLTKDDGKLSYWRSSPHTGMDTQHERAGHWKSDYDNGVDLNCYLYRECLAFALIAKARNKQEDVALFRHKAEEKRKAVQDLCWNDDDGFYYDVDNRTGQQIQVKSIAVFSPLWAQLATDQQAERLVREHLTNRKEFWRAFPVPSLAATEKGYSESYLPGDIGSLWRATTWVSTNYCIFHGLRAYGYKDVATQLADATYTMVKQIGDFEYYSSDSAKGRGLHPFWGWSLLAYLLPWENANNFDPTRLTLSDPIPHAL